tara:strand:+ start:22 stop:615 length:594 start_codon:yes stop_codon:yes gene_type:complete
MLIINYIILFLLASLPIKIIINWLFPHNKPNKTPTVTAGNSITLFGITQLLYFIIGYGGSLLAQQLFFYEDPIFNYLAIGTIILGYFWSCFYKLKPAGNLTPFILGILTFFNIHYLWFFSLIALLLIVLINHITMGLFTTLLLSYCGLLIFDIDEQFIIINTVITILFILRKNNAIIDFFSSNPSTLIQQFQNRKNH